MVSQSFLEFIASKLNPFGLFSNCFEISNISRSLFFEIKNPFMGYLAKKMTKKIDASNEAIIVRSVLMGLCVSFYYVTICFITLHYMLKIKNHPKKKRPKAFSVDY